MLGSTLLSLKVKVKYTNTNRPTILTTDFLILEQHYNN